MSKINISTWYRPFLFINPLISITILIGFICYYTVPPLVDLQGNVVMGMIRGDLLKYYNYQPALTYRLLDIIIKYWAFVFDHVFQEVILATYLTIIFLILSVSYSFCILLGMSLSRSLCAIGIIVGPIFLLLHTTHFIWGVVAYLLAVFAATASTVAFWYLESELILTGRIKIQTAIIFAIYTMLAITSHLGGFLYLAIGWSIPMLRIITINQYRLKLFGLLMAFMSILLPFFFYAWRQTAAGFLDVILRPIIDLTNPWYVMVIVHHRIGWLLTGGPYFINHLVPMQDLGIFGLQQTHQLLTAIPLLIIFLLLIIPRTMNQFSILIISELMLAIGIELFLPFNCWNLIGIYSRHWLLICAWTFIGMLFLLHITSNKKFDLLCLLSPMFVIVACYILNPLYSNFRSMPIEVVADVYSNKMLHAVSAYRKNHPESIAKDITITYYPNMINIGRPGWKQYHLVPFLMLLSPALINNKIFIKEHWLISSFPHMPIAWNEKKKFDAVQLLWDRSNNATDIILKPDTGITKIT